VSLKGKRILITAGPTWVAIDPVRIISNTATGETGIRLAEVLQRSGAEVTLILGPCATHNEGKFRIIRFSFFEELQQILTRELGRKKWDVIVHSAAVSDYRPLKRFRTKISSQSQRIDLALVRTPKLIKMIRRKSPSSLLVGFKFLPEAAPKTLIARAWELGKDSRANLVVANTVNKGAYRAFIVSSQGIAPEASTKNELIGLLEIYLETYFIKEPLPAGKCICGQYSSKRKYG
jgi:phosphopantothenoylcysteine decarboxylase / phosphopantothenate---cysteine ligase